MGGRAEEEGDDHECEDIGGVMDNLQAIFESCVTVAAMSFISLVIWLGWMVIDWIVTELEYRREMKKMREGGE